MKEMGDDGEIFTQSQFNSGANSIAPTKFDLIIMTAKALALTLTLSLLGRADEVIE